MYNLQGKPLYVCGSNKSPRPPPPPPPIPMDPSIDLHSPRLTRISRWNRCDRCQTIIDYPRFDCSQPAILSVLLPSTKIPLSPPTNIDETLENVFARFLYCCTRINTFQNNKKDSGRSRILYARHNSKKKKKKISITSFPNNSDFIRQLSNDVIVRWISLKRSTHRYAYEFLLSKFSTFMIVPRKRGTRKESVLQNSKISEQRKHPRRLRLRVVDRFRAESFGRVYIYKMEGGRAGTLSI